MSLSEIPEGELRSRFLAVGVSDGTVRMISLDPSDTLAPLRYGFITVVGSVGYCSVVGKSEVEHSDTLAPLRYGSITEVL